MNNYAYLDIETTGRFWRNSRIVYMGIAYMNQYVWQFKEWNVANEEKEPEALQALMDSLECFSQIRTYNGTGFDLPYLHNKCKAYGVVYTLNKKEHIDYRYAFASLKDPLKLLSMKQKDLELFLNYHRTDRIYGGDLHSLPILEDLYSYMQLFNGSFTLDEIKLENQVLYFSLKNTSVLPQVFSIKKEQYYIKGEQTHTIIAVMLLQTTLKCFFKNTKDYYYLPEEDQAIHKSVSQYVDKNRRVRANAQNCYQRKSGMFYPVFHDSKDMPYICKEDFSNELNYLPWQDSYLQDNKWINDYVSLILKSLIQK